MYARLNIIHPAHIYFKHLRLPVDIFNIQVSEFMFLYTKGMLAELLKTVFSANSRIHSHNTRHRRDPHVVTCLTSFIARTFIHFQPNVLFDLLNNIRTITSAGQFSFKAKKHFIGLY